MAEVSLESILESIKRLLKQNDMLSKTFEEKLNKVREIEQNLKAIIQYCDTEQQSGNNQGLEALKGMCEAVVHGDYLKEKTNAAALAEVVKKMQIEKFPESIQPKGYEIKGYIEEIAAQLEEIDNLVKEFDKMIKVFCKNQYRISETERIDLEMKKLEFEGGLEICTDYQTQAAEAMKELNSEIAAYTTRQRNAAIVKTGFAFVLGAGVGAGAGAYWAAKAGTAVAAEGAAAVVEGSTTLTPLVKGALGGAGIFGGGYGLCSVYWLTSKYEEFKGETNKLDAALKSLKAKQRKMTTKSKVQQKKVNKVLNSKQE